MRVRKVTTRLSDRSRSGWEKACLRAGVTLTALIEATGLELHNGPIDSTERGARIVELARQIDLDRRARP